MASVLVEGVRLPIAVGGHPAVDFCNTRAGWGSEHPKEYLTSAAVVAMWAREAGLLDGEQTRHAIAAATASPRRSAAVRRRAVDFRDALHAVLLDGELVDAGGGRGWPLVAAEARRAAAATTLEVGGAEGAPARWEPVGEDAILAPYLAIVRAAAELLTSPLGASVRACPMPDCGWLFADPTGRRRWCSMAWCGNRAKARRHAARLRAAR